MKGGISGTEEVATLPTDFYVDLFEGNPAPMWVSDAATLQMLAANQAAIALYGYPREEFLTKTLADLVSPEDEPGFIAFCRPDSRDRATSAQWRHRAQTGRIFDVEIDLTPLPFQGRLAVVAVVRDITCRRASEISDALRYGVTRLIAENAADITRTTLQFLAVSLGYQAAELWLLDPVSHDIKPASQWHDASHDFDSNDAEAHSCRVPEDLRGALSPTDQAIPVRADSEIIGTLFLLGGRQVPPGEEVLKALLDVCRQLGQYLKRRQAEQGFRDADREQRALFADAPVPYHEIDHLGRIVRVNRAECEVLGYDAAEMVGRPVWDFVCPSERAASRAAVARKLQGDYVPIPHERKYLAANGEEKAFQFHERLIRDSRGGVSGILTAMLDVTELRRAERRIAFHARLLETMGEAVIACDLNFRITCWNRAAENLFGWTSDEALGRTFLGVVPFEADPAGIDRVGTDLFRDGTWLGEIRSRARDGRQLTIDLSSILLLDDDRRPTGFVSVLSDATKRRQAEERIRILSQAVEQSPVSIVITDLQGRIEYANPTACRLTQYTLEELLGQNPRVLKSGFTSPDEYAGLWKTIRHGEWHGVFQNRKKSGECYWEAATIGPIRDENGTPTHYLAVKEDITSRKRMEEALQQSNERFRVAAENSADMVFEWDQQADSIEVFGGGLAHESEVRSSAPGNMAEFFARVHPDDRERIHSAIEYHQTSRVPFDEKYRVILPSGRIRHLAMHASRMQGPADASPKWVGVIQDVTEAYLAQRANAELAAVVECNAAAIISKDLSGTVLTWNPGAERIYGYSAAEMVGQSISILWGPGRAQEEAGVAARLRGGERISHLETVLVAKGGQSIDVLLTLSPLRDVSGEVVGAAHVAWNITEQKQLQLRLTQSQKLESIGHLAAGVAHEINTPIQYIGDNARFLQEAFAELMRCVTPGTPGDADVDLDYLRTEIPEAIGQLSEGVEHVAKILRAMKEFSHPGSVEKSPADLNRAIESTVAVSRNEWKYVAEVQTDLDPDLPDVPCLVGEVKQVMLNLIVNAAHAIADVKKKPGQTGLIQICTRRAGEFAEIRVRDTGKGIPLDIQSKVFDPFFTTKEVGKGTGQGLSIAHAVIVQTHQGSIRFETEEGVGTTFIVQLPLKDESQTA
jgi:PAS domain S-box-containing protein